jgi:predicted metal-dependent phosphoesterase TrpH
VNGFVDLHTHTTASDGTESPTQVVSKAQALGLVGVAITDHDTVHGVDEGLRAGTNLGIEVVPGVEISCNWKTHHVHLLGFYINPRDEGLVSLLEWMRQGRLDRLPRMLEKLEELGISVDQQEVEAEAKGESTGRPHIARVMVRNGVVTSMEEAFDKYLAYGRPAYAERPRPTIIEGIHAIVQAKGVPVLAHPLTVDVSQSELIGELTKENIQGVEYYYPYHQVSGKSEAWYAEVPSQLVLIKELARKRDLILTGGSDYHGPIPGKADLGAIQIPAIVLEQLRFRYKQLYGALPSPLLPA